MKKYDFLWIAALVLICLFLIYPATRAAFIAVTKAHPYIMGFVKVSILATMGELLALRIVAGNWKKPVGLLHRFVIWGLLGMVFAIVFDIFAGGVAAAANKGLLPATATPKGSAFLFAFLTSTFMNLIFAPTFMALHRITDTYIDLGNGKLQQIIQVKLKDVVARIDWYGFVSFIVCKTIPVFWIPAHTITFMLPPEYRVLMASFLSIALGAILAFSKRKSAKAA